MAKEMKKEVGVKTEKKMPQYLKKGGKVKPSAKPKKYM